MNYTVSLSPIFLSTGVSADLCAEILVNIALKLALLPFF